jgi:uncharacterized membrane protein
MVLPKIFEMHKTLNGWNDDKMRNIMGNLLRVGVVSAAALVLIGAILFFFQHTASVLDYHTFKSEPEKLRKFHLIFFQALHFRGREIIQFGLIVLIATPIVRVLFSLIGFFFEKDWVYVVITAIVFIVLMFSLFNPYFLV